MIQHTLTPDAEAILLLCSHLGLPKGSKDKPYGPKEWSDMARRIIASPLRHPGAMLDHDSDYRRQALDLTESAAQRVGALLSRGGQLAIELEHLSHEGIWSVTRADTEYPVRLKSLLGAGAPPVLFGAGDSSVLNSGFLAVVGSRDVDESGLQFSRAVGVRCAQEHLVVVSGMARGVDSESMFGVLDAGGAAIGVLAGGLERTIRLREVRKHISEGRLTLVTTVHPRTGPSIGTMMERNKYVYCLARFGLVVASAFDKGGTWAGAREVLRERWVPLFVRSGPTFPEGNQSLLHQGALPFDDVVLGHEGSLSQTLSGASAQWQETPIPAHKGKTKSGQTRYLFTDHTEDNNRAALTGSTAPRVDNARGKRFDLFQDAWARIRSLLAQPCTVDDVANACGLEPVQAQAWLERAEREGLALHDRHAGYYLLPQLTAVATDAPPAEQLRMPLE